MRKANLRNLGMLVLAGLMLILIPTSAKADFLDFTVDEGTVPGANAGTFVADKLNGGYAEVITFINGTFVTNAYAEFGQYFANEGSDFVTSQLGGVDANGYGLYALFSSDGAVVGNSFFGQNSQFVLYIDPENDTTFELGATGADPVAVGNDGDDYMIMEAYSLSSGFGILVPGIGGFFDQRGLQRHTEDFAIFQPQTIDGVKSVLAFGQRDAHAGSAERGDEVNDAGVHNP